MHATIRTVEDDVHRQVLAAGRATGDPVGPAEIAGLVRQAAPLMPTDEVAAVVARILARTAGLGPLEPLLDDATVTEVMVNGTGPVCMEVVL